jgi:hypothetical protein
MGLADKRILIAATSCIGILLLSTPSVKADRDGEQGNYLQRLRKRGATGGKRGKGSVSDRYDVGAASSIRLRPKVGSGSSVLTISLVLASIFWTVRFLLMRMKGWISECCRGISEVRRSLEARTSEARRLRRPKAAKSRRDEGSDAQSISTSVMEIIDLGEDSDGGSSFVSAASTIASSAFSVLSFSRIRKRGASRRSFTSSSTATETTEQLVRSYARANERQLSESFSAMPISNASRRSKLRSGMDKEHTQNGEVAFPNKSHSNLASHNNVSSLMRFIGEEDDGDAATTAKSRRQEPKLRASVSSDDVSRIPAATTNDGGRGCDRGGTRELNLNSPLEMKLSAGAARGSNRAIREHPDRVRSRR